MRRSKSALAAAAAVLAAALPLAARAECNLSQLAELPVTMRDLQAVVAVKIDGADAKLIADSGAFFSLLTPQSAKRFGLKISGTTSGLTLEGVNGDSQTALTRVKAFTVMGVTFSDTQFLVAAPQFDNDTDGLLGENFLGVTDTEFDLAHGMIRLFRPEGCANTALAYWAEDKPFSMVDIEPLSTRSDPVRVDVTVNGHVMRATLDTGSPRSMLTRRAARMVGLDVEGPGARDGGFGEGIGRGKFRTWIVPVASFKVGNEEVKHTELRVGDVDLGDDSRDDLLGGAEMLLGADFFLSHRVMVAKSQRRLYLTYNGGPVFDLETIASAKARSTPPKASKPAG